MVVDVVPGLVAEVLVVSAGVAVGDESIHRRRQPHADGEPRDHDEQSPEVEPAGAAQAVQRLAQQPSVAAASISPAPSPRIPS